MEASTQNATIASPRVLVVEDEHLVALDIGLRLGRMGHAVTIAHSGEEAVEIASSTPFDLVLMDIKLKGELDGINAAARIRGVHDVPVIYLTAYADNKTLERARETEPYAYVLKPFQERELKAAIELAVHRHEHDRQRFEKQLMSAFLADATSGMTGTLDFRDVAARAASLLVPRYADWCTIHLEAAGDAVPAYTHTRPEDRRPGNGHEQVAALIKRVLAERQLVVIHLSRHSLLGLPLLARGQLLGVLAITRSSVHSHENEVPLIEDFGHRLAMALDNALLYRQAQRAVRMRDDVLAIVSHDLRSPLATILLQAETLAPEHAKAGASIRRAAQRMHRLIGDLLDASAINAGKLSLELRTNDVCELGRDAVEMFRSQAEAHGVRLEEDLPADRVLVRCDRDRIVQVLTNLIGNAVKFTPRGGTVTLRITPGPHDARIEVIDDGSGIAPDHIPRLFDRFWRGQNTGGGAGLGLFISQGIVTAHGSTLTVASELGSGSCFSFRLPDAP